MGIHWTRISKYEQVFTHESEDGVLRHFAVERLFSYMQGSGYEVINVLIEPGYDKVIREKRGVEAHRLARLTDRELAIPVLYCMDVSPGTGLLVDGHHRYVRCTERGDETIPAYIAHKKLWSRFLVEGIPDSFGRGQLTGYSNID